MRVPTIALILLCSTGPISAQQWQRLSDLGWGGEIVSLRTSPSILFIGDHKSIDFGISWTQLSYDAKYGSLTPLTIHPTADSTIFFTTELSYPRCLVTYDAGDTFEETTVPSITRRLVINPANTSQFFAQHLSVYSSSIYSYKEYYSSDGGITWNDQPYLITDDQEPLSKSSTVPHYYEDRYLGFTADGSICLKQRWVNIDNGSGLPGVTDDYINHSTTGPFGGSSHVDGYEKIGDGATRFKGMLFSPFSVDTMFIWSNKWIQCSTDSGKILSTLYRDSGDLLSAEYDAHRHRCIVASRDSGVRISSDLGASWIAANTGLLEQPVTSLEVDAQGNVYARTSEGFYRLADSTSVGLTPEPGIPALTVLSQNYPNPFNPQTTIRYYIPRLTNILLSLCDHLGREVALIHSGMKEQGWHEATVDSDNLTSGIYFYTLSIDGKNLTRKMVLLK